MIRKVKVLFSDKMFYHLSDLSSGEQFKMPLRLADPTNISIPKQLYGSDGWLIPGSEIYIFEKPDKYGKGIVVFPSHDHYQYHPNGVIHPRKPIVQDMLNGLIPVLKKAEGTDLERKTASVITIHSDIFIDVVVSLLNRIPRHPGDKSDFLIGVPNKIHEEIEGVDSLIHQYGGKDELENCLRQKLESDIMPSINDMIQFEWIEVNVQNHKRTVLRLIIPALPNEVVISNKGTKISQRRGNGTIHELNAAEIVDLCKRKFTHSSKY